MKTRIQGTPSNLNIVLGKRLTIDRKQQALFLPNLPNRDSNPTLKSLSKEKPIYNQNKAMRSVQRKNRQFSIIPYLIDCSRRDERKFESRDKIRLKTGTVSQNKNQEQQKTLPIKRLKSASQPVKQNQKIQIQRHQYPRNGCLQISFQFSFGFHDNKQVKQNLCGYQDNSYGKQNQKQQKYTQILITQKGNTQQQQATQKKTFQSVGVVTDLAIQNDSYKEYMKFKITQNQKFEKMKKIFDYIDKFASKEPQIFDQRYQQIQNQYKQAMESHKQKGLVEICQSLNEKEQSLEKSFKRVFKNLASFQSQHYKIITSQVQMLQQQIKKIKEMAVSSKPIPQLSTSIQREAIGAKYSKNKGNHSGVPQSEDRDELLRLLSKRIDNLQMSAVELERNSRQRHMQMDSSFQKAHNLVDKNFQQWREKAIQKQCAIKVCVENILRLPEMSCAIFGMGKEHADSQENEMMRRIGVVLGDAQEFQWFSKKTKHQQVNQAFMEISGIKCLDCAYLKSKMKFIYLKHQKLAPVMKLLKFLVRWETEGIL